jgi:hypothetical protein
MSEPKLCIDCKHQKDRSCYHSSYVIDLVDGKLLYQACAIMRLEHYPCKPEAILFEPMEAVIYDIADLFPEAPFPNIRGTN